MKYAASINDCTITWGKRPQNQNQRLQGTFCCSKTPKWGAWGGISGHFCSGNQGTHLYDESCKNTGSRYHTITLSLIAYYQINKGSQSIQCLFT